MNPWRLMLEGSDEDLELFAKLYRHHPVLSVEYEHSRYWLIAPALDGESRGEIHAEAERFLGVVRGVMKVYFNSNANLHLKGIYDGPEGGGIALNVLRVKGLPDPATADLLDQDEEGFRRQRERLRPRRRTTASQMRYRCWERQASSGGRSTSC